MTEMIASQVPGLVRLLVELLPPWLIASAFAAYALLAALATLVALVASERERRKDARELLDVLLWRRGGDDS